MVGEGLHSAREVLNIVFPDTKPRPTSLPARGRKGKEKSGLAVPISGLIPGMAMHFANCCHPLPGDRIVGIVTTGKGVTIHTIDCDTLEMFADAPERWLDVAWAKDQEPTENRVGRLRVVVANEAGSLGNL